MKELEEFYSKLKKADREIQVDFLASSKTKQTVQEEKQRIMERQASVDKDLAREKKLSY